MSQPVLERHLAKNPLKISQKAKKLVKVCLHSRYPFNLANFFLTKKYPNSDFARFVDFTEAFHLKLVGTYRMYYFKSVNPAPSARMSGIFMAT